MEGFDSRVHLLGICNEFRLFKGGISGRSVVLATIYSFFGGDFRISRHFIAEGGNLHGILLEFQFGEESIICWFSN